ncbi:MAG: xylulokinase [Actinomycetota bacterium]
MKRYILAIDLGTTLIKFVLFDFKLGLVAEHSRDYELQTSQEFIEFDADGYWEQIKEGIGELVSKSGIDPAYIASIGLSSQAETLVLLDKDNNPVRKAISWLDNRSREECERIRANFNPKDSYRITGQPDIITTWPITKILWIKDKEREVFKRTRKFLLLKDYIIYKLTGRFVSEYSIYNFSYYFNIITKEYWDSMLDFVGVDREQLPELIEPGKEVGPITASVAEEFGFDKNLLINAGALDQMAGMIGVGNIREGVVSETTGTVLTISTLIEEPVFSEARIPCHYSAIRGKYVLLPVCESGGISLEWFKRNFYKDKGYAYIDKQAENVSPGCNDLLFLPYLTGVNAPEYNADARGVFYGINIQHNESHFARAVMEGVAFLLKKNLDFMESSLNIRIEEVFSLGGGANSQLWNQIKSDVLDKQIKITSNRQPTALGAAMLSAVDMGLYRDLASIAAEVIRLKKTYSPKDHDKYLKPYRTFINLYQKLEPFFSRR